MPVQIETILKHWEETENICEVARRTGVTRQNVSYRLIQAGINPTEIRAERGRQKRISKQLAIAEKLSARAMAYDNLKEYAESLGVTVSTLGAYVMGTAAYGVRAINGNYIRYSGRCILPRRDTPEYQVICDEAKRICHPWNARTIAQRNWK